MALGSAVAFAAEAPTGLMVELLREPDRSVITEPHPAFSWMVIDPRRGAVQTAYQILVASSEALLAEDRADVWDSARVASPDSTGVLLGGSGLRPQEVYWWKVRIWDGEGREGAFSVPQRFQTGDFTTQRAWAAESRWVPPPGGATSISPRCRSGATPRVECWSISAASPSPPCG